MANDFREKRFALQIRWKLLFWERIASNWNEVNGTQNEGVKTLGYKIKRKVFLTSCKIIIKNINDNVR